VKVAQVSPYDFSYPGAVPTHILKLSQCLEQAGHEVRILAPCSRKTDSLKYPNLFPVGRPIPIPSGGSIARVALSPRVASKVKDILQQERFDIIHLHEPLAPILPITVLRLSTSINVGTFHAYNSNDRMYRYTSYILKRWFRKLDGKIAVSQPARDFIGRYFPGTYALIPNGIDVAQFSAAHEPVAEFMDGKVNILFVGRMEKRKGLRYLIKAYSKLKWDHPNIRLIVVGPGKLDPDSERALGERPTTDVVLVGGVSYEELPRYYHSAHIFCSPATGQESFGVVLLEAMAAGKPIVASNISGYASVLQDGQAALMVPPKDEDALVAALARLLQDQELCYRLGEQGPRIVQRYDWSTVSQEVLDYYHQLRQEKRSLHHST
jgi:phosphatidylinositol alpha-mannosyltransferase